MLSLLLFSFTATATTDIYPLSLHDALPICGGAQVYAQALPLCSDLFLTLVKRAVEGDAFLPPFEDHFELTEEDRKSTRLNSSHLGISYAVFCLKKKKKTQLSNRTLGQGSMC